MKFLEKMAEYNLHPGEIKSFGKIQRFAIDGKNLNGWLWYNQADGCEYGAFGNWQDGTSVTFTDFGEGKSKKEIDAIKAEFEKIKKDCEMIREQEARESAEKAERIWSESIDGNHEYLERKKIKAFGTRTFKDSLIVPVRKNKKIVSLQFIGPNKDSKTKKFLTNGVTKGGAFYIPGDENKMVICEGFATGASIHMATGYSVVIAFYAGNLKPVALSLREARPKANIIIACDNDQHKEINTGVKLGSEAASAIGASFIIPYFRDLTEKPTDFNDLHVMEGIEEVRKQIKDNTTTLYDDVKEWCLRHSGEFTFQEIVNHYGYKDKAQKDAIDNAIQQLKSENIVQSCGVRRGVFRVVDFEEQKIDITKNIRFSSVEFKLPFDLHECVAIQPKNIIIIAGESNAGKTAIMLESLRENILDSEFRNPVYISSEMGESEFKMRALGVDQNLEIWKQAEIIDKSHNYQDVVLNGRKDKLIYIDYLEPPPDSGYAGIENSIKVIRDSLGKGVAIIALQKTKGKDTARGGDGTLSKARLYITLKHCYHGIYGTVNMAKILKCKMVMPGKKNPTGQSIFYTITKGGGCRSVTAWGYVRNMETTIANLKEQNPEASDNEIMVYNNNYDKEY